MKMCSFMSHPVYGLMVHSAGSVLSVIANLSVCNASGHYAKVGGMAQWLRVFKTVGRINEVNQRRARLVFG